MTVATIKPEPDQQIINTLKDALHRAESGEIDSLVLIGTNDDRSSFSAYTHKVGSEPLRWLGELDLLKRDLMDLCDRRISLLEQL